MWKCSVEALLLLLMFVNVSNPSVIVQSQSSPIFEKTKWSHEKYDLQDELYSNLESRAVHVTEVSEEQRHWALMRVARSTEKLQNVCACFGSPSAPSSGCNFDIGEFGPILFNGRCLNGTQWRRQQHRRQYLQVKDDVSSVSRTFLDMPLCAGTRPLLLVSSGEKQTLRLSNVPSVWVCPRSLGAPLQHLAITNVPEVKIASGALAHRLTNFTMSLTGVSEELVFPHGALSVDMVERKNIDDTSNNLMENVVEHHLPSRIKVIIENANLVKFESGSVLAPRVWVEVRLIEKLEMETQAMEALSSPTDFVLHISSIRALYMKSRAANFSSLCVTNVSTVLLMEESVVVMVPGGEVIMRDVENVVANERAIILGNGAALELSYVTFKSKSNGGLFSQSPLRSVVLRGVKVTGSNSTSICLATHTLSLRGVTAELSDHSAVYACLRFVSMIEMETTEESGVVLCEVSSKEKISDLYLCADPRCKACGENETESSEDAEGNWWEEPMYMGSVATFVLLALLLLFSYRLHRYSKGQSMV
ncbi:hypothetical protein GWK47_009198 [Chionoecetes opilio]|uniref:Uncharacterized protein n=1 Tax=Chionoecetes opilio TaxID=41210 RepID=A0A8J4XYP9_CHIOP|nr:hypothetical protein GWK47_009198 [Chionoecetes opilio]